MVVGEVAEGVDALVIGGGPGGYTAALRLAAEGRRVTLVERGALGGTCLHTGCIPSKALLEVAAGVEQARAGEAWGARATVEVDLAAVRAHAERTVEGLRAGVAALLADAGVDVRTGTAAFTRPDRVVVDQGEHVAHLEFGQVLLATGSAPLALPALPFDGTRVLDAAGALALDALPSSVVVVGGGYIGVELATAFHRLGATVTVVEQAQRLLPDLRPAWLGDVCTAAFRRRGIVLHLEATVHGAGDGTLHVSTSGGPVQVPADVVVVAIGRAPATAGLGLDRAGIATAPDGRIPVAADRRAGPHVWAVGDLTDGPALAHKATAEAAVAARSMCGHPARFDPACIPQVVFADPEVVSVGLTADDLVAAGVDAVTGRFPLAASARARTFGTPPTAGAAVEVVADADGTVRGVHIAGPHVAELAGEAALAVELAATLEDLASTIHPHPTLSESLAEAAMVALGRPLHARRPSARPRSTHP
jgi:dihydrolipoamide dehydrogenase